jgi:hypothetical protein
VAASSEAGETQLRRGGSKAPISQNSGMKIPMMNMTQWPFRMDRMPKVKRRTSHKIPKANHPPLLTASNGIGGLRQRSDY